MKAITILTGFLVLAIIFGSTATAHPHPHKKTDVEICIYPGGCDGDPHTIPGKPTYKKHHWHHGKITLLIFDDPPCPW